MGTRRRFRELIDRDKILLMPAVHDALTARLAEHAGVEAIGLSGYGVSLSRLGLPDAGFVSFDDVVESARAVAETTNAPVLTDTDTGFGNALSARRTTRTLIEMTDVAGLFMEDQVAPKRCGHVAGKEVLPIDEAVGKFQAVCDARDEFDETFVVVARTDARGAANGSLEEAIERGNAYAEVGADVVFVEGPTSREEVREIGERVNAPLLYNQGMESPLLEAEFLAENGYAISFVVSSLFPTMTGVYDQLLALRESGIEAERSLQESIEGHPVADLHAFSGFDEIRDLEEAYLPAAAAARYERSIGSDVGGGE